MSTTPRAPSRDTSPTRGGVSSPQAGSPVRPCTPGEPMSYGPGLDQATPGFSGDLGTVPLGVLHGSGAGLAGNPGWAGNPFTMQAPDGAGLRVPQREEAQVGGGTSEVLRREDAQGGSGGVREVLGQRSAMPENAQGGSGGIKELLKL